MEELMFELEDGKKIFMRYFSNLKDVPTVLYLHGGPGASCECFHYAAHCLAEKFNVIMIDQRGVLRSERVEEKETLTVQMLVDDCEYIRKFYGIDQLVVLGHSFGGTVALLYAHQYPESIKAVIYENPGWEGIGAVKTIHKNTIKILNEKGYYQLAEKIQERIENSSDLTELVNLQQEIPREVLAEVYYTRPISEEIKKYWQWGELTSENDKNSELHRQEILKDRCTNQDLSSYLEQIKIPSLLIRGDRDPIRNEAIEEYFLQVVSDGQLVVLEDCGHTAHTDQVKVFCEIVSEFIEKAL